MRGEGGEGDRHTGEKVKKRTMKYLRKSKRKKMERDKGKRRNRRKRRRRRWTQVK